MHNGLSYIRKIGIKRGLTSIPSKKFIRSFAALKMQEKQGSTYDARRSGGGRIYARDDGVFVDDDDDDDDFESLVPEVDEEPLNIDFQSLFDQYSCPKPSEIVQELDKFIIGQDKAKRSVAIALRNRWRAKSLKKVDKEMDVTPSNMLMVGPTGCGKTEIARRLAKIADAPFIKVEATNYTEVGFHGRDVDKIMQDLFDSSLQLIRDKVAKEVNKRIDSMVEKALVDVLAGPNSAPMTKDHFRDMIRQDELEDQLVKIDIESTTGFNGSGLGMGKNGVLVSQNLADILNLTSLKGKKIETKSMKVSTARQKLRESFGKDLKEELEETQTSLALSLAQERGIVFIDEIDKICSHESSYSPNASSEGVQRDLLPLVEGSNVPIKQGVISTDNVLFICAGSFHSVNVSDLIPELQGRLPIRVELEALSEEQLSRTLKLEKSSLLEKYKALLRMEEVLVDVENEDCLDYMAKVAFEVNKNVENIGARRLNTIVDKVLEDLSFAIPEIQEALQKMDIKLRQDSKHIIKVVKQSLGDEAQLIKVSVEGSRPVLSITKEYLEKKLGGLIEKVDLEKFIL